MQLITDWEKQHGREYPHWAAVWHYDAYGECWDSEIWDKVKDFYKTERSESYEKSSAWEFYYEPMVLLPTDEHPKWGDGVMLKREIKQ